MKVKKPQSKRKSTKLQKGIQKKVSAHNRKQKKLAKKDVTWKSRKPADPGIPNSFPFKAQLLEEIELKRQESLQERQRRREEFREQARAQGATEEDIEQLDSQSQAADRHDRLSALVQSAQEAAAAFDGEDPQDQMELDDDDESEETQELDEAFSEITQDSSRKAFDKHFKQVVDACDVLVYVLDARNPDGTRSSKVEQLILSQPNKRLIFAINKCDLIPHNVLERWIVHLNRSFPTLALISGSAENAHTFEHPGMTRASTATKFLESLKKYASQASLKRAVTVGIVGYPNVGKSSVINSLLSRRGGRNEPCVVGAQAGVTADIKRLKVDGKLVVYDCPGIVFPVSSAKKLNALEQHSRLVLLNAVPSKHLGDCRPAVTKLLKRLQKRPEQMDLFKKHYDLVPLSTDPFDNFVTGVLIQVARKLGRLGKGGIPDLESAAQAIIIDWRDGRVSGWAEPPEAPKTAASDKVVVSEWAQEFSLD